jgi:D-glycero-D-manno-heptose 1,7-bisphosphate phosphatase
MGVHLSGFPGRAVFLDRDGVINQSVMRDGVPCPPATAAETVLVEGSGSCLASLKRAGFLLIVVTNQPDVRRGTTSREGVESINEWLTARLPLDDFFVCYHDEADNCACRKPHPGLLLEASARHNLDFRNSFLIGDRWRDVDAGAAAGCRTILIDHGYNERRPRAEPDVRVQSLSEAVDWILKEVEFN